MKKLLTVIIVMLFIGCLGVSFLAGDAFAAVVDYGFEIFGKEVTSSYSSNSTQGWSYNASTKTLTLENGMKLTDAYVDFLNNGDIINQKKYVRKCYEPRPKGMNYYVAAINLKAIDNITINVPRLVEIGKYVWQRTEQLSNELRTYGIYGLNTNVTITGGGELTMYNTDSGIYLGRNMEIKNVKASFYSNTTAALFTSSGTITINDGAEVYAHMTCAGSIYKSYASESDYSKDKNGEVRHDSMAAVVSCYNWSRSYALIVRNGSTLNVDATAWYIKDDKRYIADNGKKLDNGVQCKDERSFYGLWAENSTTLIENNSRLNVTLNVESGRRAYFDFLMNHDGKYYYFRTIAVNTERLQVYDSDVVARLQPAATTTESGECGHDADVFYSESYSRSIEENDYKLEMTYNSQCASIIDMRGDSSIEARLAERYYDSDGNDVRENHIDRAFDTNDLRYTETYNNQNYYLKQYQSASYDNDRYIYKYLKSHKRGDIYYFRENSGGYEYSEYLDFRSVTPLRSNDIDIAAAGWTGKTINVKSGDFIFRLPKNNDGKFIVDNVDASIKFQMEGGTRYNGRYDVSLAGLLTVEGDGIIKELYTENAFLPDWEGDPFTGHYASGKIHVKSGTIAGGSSGNVRIDVTGGNVAFNEDMKALTAYEGSAGILKRITIELGEFADKLKWQNIHISYGYSYDATGIYPVNGEIYLWELSDKLISFDRSRIAFHHLDITEDYTYYVFPKAVTDSEGHTNSRHYTLYRLEERDELVTIGDSDYYVAAGSSLELNSFCYRKVVDMPLNRTLSDTSTETVELPGSRTTALKSGEHVEWTLVNHHFGTSVSTFSTSDTSFKTNTYEFSDYDEKYNSDYKCTLYSSDNTVKATYNFNIHVLTFTNISDKNVSKGETAKFDVGHYTNGTWVQDNCVTFGWEMQKNGSDVWTSIGTGSNVLEYTATEDSHLSKFRRVAKMPREDESEIKLVSPAMTLNMGVYITGAPNTVNVHEDIPEDSIQLKVDAGNWEQAIWYKKDGDKLIKIDGANTPTLTFQKSEYTNGNGKWDVSQLTGTYVCELKSITYPNKATAEIVVMSQDSPHFNYALRDVAATVGKKAVFKIEMSNLYYSLVEADGTWLGFNNDVDIWWEYSTDGGDTWTTISEKNETKPIYVVNDHGLDIVFSDGTRSWINMDGRATWYRSSLYINGVDGNMDQSLFRCVMKDKYAKYYSTAAKLLLFSVSESNISKQPQSQTLNLKTQTTAALDFEFDTELPENFPISYQWQKRASGESEWTDISSTDSMYKSSGQRLEILDVGNFGTTSVDYRCKITVTEAGKTGTFYTAEANLYPVCVPKFTTAAPVSDDTEVWEGGSTTLRIATSTPTRSITWEVCKDGSKWTSFKVDYFKNSSEITIENLTPEMNNWLYRCKARHENNGVANETISEPTKLPRVRSGECLNADEMTEAMSKGYTTLKIMQDFKLSSLLDLTDKQITIDLNGHTLTGNITLADNSAAPDSILTLIDSAPNGGGVLNGKITLTRGNGSKSHLYANGGTITGMVSLPSYAGGIFCTSDTPTVFKGHVGNYGEIHGGIFFGTVNTSCIKEKTVTFMNGDNRYALEVVATGNKVVAPKSPVKAGYAFDGWYNGDTKYTFGSTIDANITLTAKFSDAITYNIACDLDGGIATNTTSYTVESDAVTLNNPTKVGYIFTGWSGTGLTGEDNMTVTIPKGSTGDRAYTAHYTAKSGYSVVFDTDGGSDVSSKTDVKWTDKVLDGITAPTKDGWRFIAWKCGDLNVTADTAYGDLVTDDTTASVTLVAQWQDIDIPVISGVENGKTYCSKQTVSVSDNGTITSVTVNGKTVTLDENNRFTLSAAKGEQKIVVTDNAENTAEVTVTVNDGHTEVIIPGKAATCTESGLTDGKKCSVCGEILVKQTEIAAKGHTYVKVAEVPATVDSTGIKEHYKCSVCDKLFDMDKKEVTADALVIPKLEPTVKYGDVNGDGKITLLDLIAMRKHLAKWSVKIDTAAADCNADGKVNLLDLILMRKYLAKWNVVLGPQK